MSNLKSALLTTKDSKPLRKRTLHLRKDEEISAANKRLEQIKKEEYKLKAKVEKRASAIFKKILLEVIPLDKWQLCNVDLYQRQNNSFLLSFELLSDFAPEKDKKINYLGFVKNKYKQGATTMIAPGAPDKKERQKSIKAAMTFRDLTYQMEIMGISQIHLGDDCVASVGYNYMTIESFGQNAKQNVFDMIKKLGIIIDYSSHLKAIELAESEIALRKRLINDISAKSLFAI